MRRVRTWVLVICVAGATQAIACTFNIGTMTALATHNVNAPSSAVGRQVEGRDCVYWVLGIPVSGSLVPNLQEAIDRAMAQVPEGDAMTNVALYDDPTFYLVGGSNCLRVKGEVVKLAQNESSAGGQR
jgi:hypothetical protein